MLNGGSLVYSFTLWPNVVPGVVPSVVEYMEWLGKIPLVCFSTTSRRSSLYKSAENKFSVPRRAGPPGLA